MTYKEWFEANKKYIYGADVDAWCETAFEAGTAYGAEQAKAEPDEPDHNELYEAYSDGIKYAQKDFEARIKGHVEESRAYKEAYFKLLESIASMKAFEPVPPILISVQLKAEPWQPIETAPQDGTVFLGYNDGRIGMASRVQRTDCEMWTFAGTTASTEHGSRYKPTHWIPIPNGPHGITKD